MLYSIYLHYYYYYCWCGYLGSFESHALWCEKWSNYATCHFRKKLLSLDY